MAASKVTIAIDYHEKMAYITGAVHDDGITEYDMKGLKKKLNDQAKADGYYGLEFWNFAEHKHTPGHDFTPGNFTFEILDQFGLLR